MAYELVYTSAPEGLSRGSSGFCVVACTKGLGPRLVLTLEGLSAYKPLYPHYAPNAWDNPISRTHYICEANGERQHILSRICFNGVDHTRRSNKLASHLVLSDRETAAAQGGPSSLLLHEELFKDASWVIKAEYFPKQKEIPATAVQVQKCMRWESVMGDAGWAGYLAQTYIDSPGKNVYIAYNPEQNKDILPLIHEAMQLLPDELRWKVTFNTYFVSLPAGMSCSWRCCPADSDAMRAAKRSPMNIVIDITKQQVLEKDGELITVARTGIIESPEEIPAAAESKENEISGNVPETDNLICLPKANLSQIGLQNKTGNLRVPQTGNRPDAVNRQQSDGCSAESRKPVWGMRKKTAAAIVLVLCMLSAGIGGFAFWFSAAKEKQIYLVQSGKYRDLRAEYDNVKSRCGEIRNKKSDVRTETQVNSLIADVKELKNKAETVKAAAEKLMVYQNLFEKRQMQEIASGVAADDTPRALIEMCETLQKDLERELSSLNIRKEVKEQQEKKKVIQAPKKKAVPLPLLSEPVKASPKTAATQVPAKKPEKKPVKTVQLFQADDSCYLWLKSASLHEMMKMAGSVDIHTGAADPDKISIFLVPNTDRQEVGAELRCTNEFDRDVVIETKFNKDNGTLSFVQKEMHWLPDNREILVERDGKA